MFLFFYGVFFIFDKLKQNNLEKENKWNKTNQWENEIEQLHAIIRKTSLDELPQSAAGKTIMTTEPKFVPSTAAKIQIEDFNSRLLND